MDYCYDDMIFYYMDDSMNVQAAFLSPEIDFADRLLFESPEACRDYWAGQVEWEAVA